MLSEAIDWNLPLVGKEPGWGYSRRWSVDSSGKSVRTMAEFVDEFEHPIPRPRLDPDGEKSLNWIPPLGPLSELKLPQSLLR